jgi:leucyl/phenylalanyl-tRNA--protein transferase
MISSEVLLDAYCQGIFPMAMENGEIGWFSPDPRGIIPLEDFMIPHGLRRTLKRNPFEIRINGDFTAVMRACAQREETWISEEIIASYVELHRRGWAHSVEAWHEGQLVGGLYGVAIRGVFFGESMFHRMTDASKVALWALRERLVERGYVLLDTQWTTPHLEQFGAHEIPRTKYLKLLEQGLQLACRFV